MKQIYLSLIFCILLVSCGKKELTVEGTVADAQGKLLIFEKAAVSQMSIIDTLTLKKDGKFKFKTPAPVSPEFYILRLDNQIINIIGDSTETIKITTDAKNFASNYTVEGSQETENIKFVIRKASELRRQFVSLNEAYTSKKISAQIFSDSVKSLSDKYKLDVRPYIFENPASGAAYFTLFQKVNGLQMFDPYDKEDYRAFGAVATSWDAHFKESDRAKQLVQITLSALSTRKKAASTDEIPVIQEQNNIEIVLPNVNGKQVKLSDMLGKVVLLDFTAYEADYSGPYNIGLAKIYDKYKSKGFEIFQVSLDTDEHFWKVAASNLPWTTVRDKASVYSTFARSYNVTNLPTSFLLGKDGAILLRVTDNKSLEEAIQKQL